MVRRFRTRSIGLLVAVGLLATAATAGATTYAPVNRPGPELSVPVPRLAAALQCNAPLAGAAHPPVLLVPGTTLNPTTDFSYGWEPALRRLGYPYCTIDLPGNAMANIETAGEYVVSAIRTMHAAYGGRIDIIGHSQGGMVPRWALRFWPDTRAMVDDLIGLSPSNHGTLDAIPLCEVGCAASIWRYMAGEGRSPTWRSRRCVRPTRRSTSGSGSMTTPRMPWPSTRSPIPGPPTPPVSPAPSAWIR